MKYKCNCCNKLFDEPEILETTYEFYYGISGMFPDTTPLTLKLCPYCGEEDIEEFDEEEELL